MTVSCAFTIVHDIHTTTVYEKCYNQVGHSRSVDLLKQHYGQSHKLMSVHTQALIEMSDYGNTQYIQYTSLTT